MFIISTEWRLEIMMIIHFNAIIRFYKFNVYACYVINHNVIGSLPAAALTTTERRNNNIVTCILLVLDKTENRR